MTHHAARDLAPSAMIADRTPANPARTTCAATLPTCRCTLAPGQGWSRAAWRPCAAAMGTRRFCPPRRCARAGLRIAPASRVARLTSEGVGTSRSACAAAAACARLPSRSRGDLACAPRAPLVPVRVVKQRSFVTMTNLQRGRAGARGIVSRCRNVSCPTHPFAAQTTAGNPLSCNELPACPPLSRGPATGCPRPLARERAPSRARRARRAGR